MKAKRKEFTLWSWWAEGSEKDSVMQYRWCLSTLFRGLGDCSVTLERERNIGSSFDQRWNYGGNYYSVGIVPDCSFTRTHAWYDGPHDSLHIGFLKFSWQGDSCDSCESSK